MAGKTQMDFFERFEQPRVDARLPPEERLERLQAGPASNKELAEITHRFSARFYDLRKAGHVIECIEFDYATGVRVYRLKQDGGGCGDGHVNG